MLLRDQRKGTSQTSRQVQWCCGSQSRAPGRLLDRILSWLDIEIVQSDAEILQRQPMKSKTTANLFRTIVSFTLASLFNPVSIGTGRAAVVSFPAQNRASGVEWNLAWSNPNQEGHLGVGGSVFGQTGQTSTQLRFDVTPLKGAYSKINSVTIRLTQGSTDWSQSFMRFGGTIEAY